MKKRPRKATVRLGIQKQWVHRIENGESLRDIADSDHVDIRTVKGYLELVQHERDMKEVRQAILRQTLEKHYGDLCAFAEKLDAKLMEGFSHISFSPDDARLFKALQQHIPDSPIWKAIEEWENILTELESLSSQFNKLIIDRVEERLSRKAIDSEEKLKLVLQLRALAKGWKGDVGVPYTTDRFEDEETQFQHSVFSWVGPNDVLAHVQPADNELMDAVTDRPEYVEVSNYSHRLKELRDKLRDELNGVMLKGILPGQCAYCPS